MKLKSLLALSFLPVIFGLTSCEEPTGPEATLDQIAETRKALNGDIVVSAHAYMGENLLTGLPTGAPMKYNITWAENEDKFDLKLEGFSVAKMPLQLFFYITGEVVPQRQWDEKEMPGDGWVKFVGKNGVTSFNEVAETPAPGSDDRGELAGFYNVKTHEIEFTINFNIMNIKTEVFRQKLDPSRVDNYEEELKKFAEDYAKWKAEQGL